MCYGIELKTEKYSHPTPMTTKHSNRLFSALFSALLTTFLLSTDDAVAVGFGRLTVYSGFGKPLDAEVELTDASVGDQPLTECFRIGAEGSSTSNAPVITRGRVTLEQYANHYRLRISSDQPINESVVQLSLRKGCGAEVTRNYLVSVPGTRVRSAVDGDRSLRLPRARHLTTSAKGVWERQLDRQTTGRELARKRHPGKSGAQARYLRALQAANPDIDFGSRGQSLLSAGTWLSIPGEHPRLPVKSLRPRSTQSRQSQPSASPETTTNSKTGDRVIVSSGRPANDSTASQPPGNPPVVASQVLPTAIDETRLLAAVDLQNEQQRLLSEKIRLLDERIRELQKATGQPTAVESPAAVASPPASSTSPAPASAAVAPLSSVTLPPVSPPQPAAAPSSAASVAPSASTSSPTPPNVATPMKPRTPNRPSSNLWTERRYEILGALVLVLAVAALWFLRRRAQHNVAMQAQTILPESIGGTPSEPTSRWQLVGESENLSVFDHGSAGNAKGGTTSAGHSPAATPSSSDQHNEVTGVLELAEIMVSFGRLAGAAQSLEEFIANRPQVAVTPWLKLLEIYRQNGQRDAFDALGIRLRKHFNVAPPDWEAMDENSFAPLSTSDALAIPVEQLMSRLPTLAQLPHIQSELLRTWATPECADYIDKLLRDNRNGERRGFLLGTVRELLLLSDLLETQIKSR